MEKTLTGTLIKDEKGCIWRIIQSNGMVTKGCLVECNGTRVTKLRFYEWSTIELMNDLMEDRFEKVKEEPVRIIPEQEMDKDLRELYMKRKAFVTEVVNLVAPNYDEVSSSHARPKIKKLYQKYEFCTASGLKYIRLFLQSGLSYSSLIDGRITRTTGRPKVGERLRKAGPKCNESSLQGKILGNDDLKNIEWGIDLYMDSFSASVEYCYLKMLIHFYLDDDGYLKNEFPSRRQFKYQLMSRTTAEERARAKKMKSDFENNSRLLYGTPRSDSLRPGQILESDECELDVMVVSSVNSRKILGRPVVYFLCDLYSHAIVGLSVHLHNNSMAGITSALLNLFESKQDYCLRFDINLADPSLWPSCFIPEEIRSDQGSEYGSDQFERICQSLNIRRSMAPGGMGSYKGAVERSFGSLMVLLRPELENYGLIAKRVDSNHYKTATYTMKEITKLCINFAVFHNNMVIDKMKISREMAMNGVKKSPVDIWRWGVEHRGMPTRMVTSANLAETIYDVLTPMTARLSRNGVVVQGLKYLPSDDEDLIARLMRTAIKGKSETMDVRIDPRNTDNIFYLKNGRIAQMNLIKEDIGNDWNDMYWDEVEAEKEIIRAQDRQDQNEKLKLRCKELSNIEKILDNAEKPEFKPEKKNIRENRMDERRLIDERESAAAKIESAQSPTPPVPDKTLGEKKTQEGVTGKDKKNDVTKGKEASNMPAYNTLSNRDAFIEAMEDYGRLDY